MTSLAERVLEAIEAAEHTVTGRNQFGWLLDESPHTKHCGYRMGAYDDPCECPVGAAVLRRCAADRKTVESYRKTCRIRDEIEGSGKPGWQLTHADLDTWSRADLEASIMEEGVRNLAEAYGVPLEQEET